MFKNFSKMLCISLISGIGVYWLIKEREYSEMQWFADLINVDINGYVEAREHTKMRNYYDLLIYKYQLPEQCIEQYKKIKKEIKRKMNGKICMCGSRK